MSGRRLVEVVLDFVVDVTVGGGWIDERADATRQLAQESHGSSLGLEQTCHGGYAPRPVGSLGLELPSSRARELVELRAPRVLRLPPFGVEPAGALEALQGGEERARVHLEHTARDLLDAARDAEPVHGLEAERLED